MPRRQPKPSLWQRLLAFIGLGGSGKKPKKAPADRAKESSKPKLRSTAVPGKPAAKKARKERPAERVEVTTPRLYLGNLSYDASESDLQELLNGVGTVKDIEVIYNSHTQRSKGYAFANMMSVDEARRAVDELHGKDYMGRKLVVSGARAPRQEREVA